MSRNLVRVFCASLIVGVITGCATPPTVQHVSAAQVAEAEEQATADTKEIESFEHLPSPAFEQPWPVHDFSRQELVSTALARTIPVFDARSKAYDVSKLQLFVDPIIPAEAEKWIDQLAVATFLTWSEDLDSPVNLVVGMSNEFLRTTVEENGLVLPEISPGEACHYDYGACSSSDTVWVGWGSQPVHSLSDNSGAARMLAHKGFHTIQDRIDWVVGGQIPPRETAHFRPVWFVEGSAEFYAYAVNDYLGAHPYTGGKSSLPFTSLRDLEEWEGLRNSDEPYFWGQVATEYIVANIGFDGYTQIYRALGDGASFEEAFVNGAGIELDTFYESFDLWANNYAGAGG